MNKELINIFRFMPDDIQKKAIIKTIDLYLEVKKTSDEIMKELKAYFDVLPDKLKREIETKYRGRLK